MINRKFNLFLILSTTKVNIWLNIKNFIKIYFYFTVYLASLSSEKSENYKITKISNWNSGSINKNVEFINESSSKNLEILDEVENNQECFCYG